MDLADAYREHGPAIFAACRRAAGDERAAVALTPRVFVRLQQSHRLGDLAAAARVAHELAVELKGPRLLRDPAPPTEADIARARERFLREVARRTFGIVERDQRPPRVLRWLTYVAPVWVALAFAGMFLASKNPMRQTALELYAGERRLVPGARVKRGARVRAIVQPGGYPYVTVYYGPRVVQHIDHATAARVELDRPIVVEEAPFHVWVAFGHSARGMPANRTGIELDVE
jgi:hypothetical protein